MDDDIVFLPEKRLGQVFQVTAILLFSAAAGLGLLRASQASIGPAFLLYLLPGLLAVGVVPLLAYRLYALTTAYYALERDGIRLRWGLRIEEIPMTAVMWVHPASELAVGLPLPWLRWPGAVVGTRHVPGVGEVEFLAARARGLVLIGTPQRIYALSFPDPQAFLLAFQRLTELGSLTPLAGRSVYPTFLISRVWRATPARILLLVGSWLSLMLLIWVSLAIPGHEQIPLGFRPDGSPGDLVPAVRLLLLPVVNTAFFLADVFGGLFLYRHEESHPLAYLLWAAGVLTPLLFLVAVFFILYTGTA